jgi:DNA-binding beta-propeller fold protein YncE
VFGYGGKNRINLVIVFRSNDVTKLRASDGANLGTFPVGINPVLLAFDGSNIWVASYVTSNVTKLRASDGANLGTFPAGTHSQGVAFDGANIWVTNSDSNTVSKF